MDNVVHLADAPVKLTVSCKEQYRGLTIAEVINASLTSENRIFVADLTVRGRATNTDPLSAVADAVHDLTRLTTVAERRLSEIGTKSKF